MADNLKFLPPSAHLTVDQAKAVISREDWQAVLAVGYGPDGGLMIRSSHMTREQAHFLLALAQQWALGFDTTPRSER